MKKNGCFWLFLNIWLWEVEKIWQHHCWKYENRAHDRYFEFFSNYAAEESFHSKFIKNASPWSELVEKTKQDFSDAFCEINLIPNKNVFKLKLFFHFNIIRWLWEYIYMSIQIIENYFLFEPNRINIRLEKILWKPWQW